jgi:hypothetical protein
MQRAIADQLRRERLGDRCRLAVRVGMITDFKPAELQLLDFDRQRQSQAIGQQHGLATRNVGHAQTRRSDAADDQSPAQQLARAPVQLQRFDLDIERLTAPMHGRQEERAAERAGRLFTSVS